MSLRSSSQESLPQSTGSTSSHASPVASDASGEFPDDDEHTSRDPWYSANGPSDTTTLTITRDEGSEGSYRYSPEEEEDPFAAHHHHTVTAVAKSLPATEEDMRAKMTLALEEHLQDHPDITARYEHRLSIEGSSPKPCIVPGNALQLIDEDHSKTSPPPPSSIIILNSTHAHDKSPTPDTSSCEHENTQKRPIPRVRFRSRVRITSGIHRNRRSSTGGTTGTANSTPSSSTSGSPSSSISAPLRWQADENATWGPLGRRLSAYAQSNSWQRRSPNTRTRQNGNDNGTTNGNGNGVQSIRSKQPRVDERTPLISHGRPKVAYVDSELDGARPHGRGADGDLVDEDEEEDVVQARDRALRAAALRREEDAVFGRWPWRLFNRHWWWWHLEPVVCCCCPDDSDYEE